MKKILFFAGLAMIFSSCVQLRDYTGARDGAFGLERTKRIGKGVASKDYYVVSGGEGIVKNDTKDEVFTKMGTPDKIETSVEGYELWFYEERKVKLTFENDALLKWTAIE
ncbi:MAG: hypothetical protein PHV17_04760 [Candidatus Omnitrophica bacterium]|nr:hypothetical protein [Candidatus Omnitrophota bacterium]